MLYLLLVHAMGEDVDDYIYRFDYYSITSVLSDSYGWFT